MSRTSQVVVGLDESHPSRDALVWAARYARTTGASLIAIHVLERPTMNGLYAYTVEADTVYYDASRVPEPDRLAAEKSFAEMGPEAGWKLLFAQGNAGRILVQESQAAGLLVLGAREHQGIGRLLNPSTGHYCLSHAKCPVVAVPVGTFTPAVAGTSHVAQPVD